MITNHTRAVVLESRCFLCSDKSVGPSLICGGCWGDLLINQPNCYRCGRGINHQGFCSACLKTPGTIDSTITLFPYQFPVDRLLFSLKYKNQLLLAQEFGRRIAEKVLFLGRPLPNYIVPVPLHPARLFGRGYNQALELSRAISARLSTPISYGAIKRIRNTLPQYKLTPAQRRKNIRGAFKPNNCCFDGPVVIIDDIVTTGHTANELALQLMTAGATEVHLWAFIP